MHVFISEIKTQFSDAYTLTKKCLYKGLEFQLLFKTIYLTGFLFILNYATTILLRTVNYLSSTTESQIPFTAEITRFFDLQLLTTTTTTAVVAIFLYLIEKHGLIYITAHYKHDHFVTFFRSLFIGTIRTPKILLIRIREIQPVIYLLFIAYVIWRICLYLDLFSGIHTGFFATLIALLSILVYILITFKNTFTPYIVSINPKESVRKFNDKTPKTLTQKRLLVIIAHYVFFIITALAWIAGFYLATKALVYTSSYAPEYFSFIVAFFISFTIIAIVLVLSIIKTFKVSLITNLYYAERFRQGKDVLIQSSPKKKLSTTASFRKTVLIIIILLLISSSVLTFSIKQKTDTILYNAESYITSEEFAPIEFNKDSIYELINKTQEDHSSLRDTVSNIVFSFFALSIVE